MVTGVSIPHVGRDKTKGEPILCLCDLHKNHLDMEFICTCFSPKADFFLLVVIRFGIRYHEEVGEELCT